MKTFFLTVQNRYRNQKHPQDLHPDGWVEIKANDYEEAQKIAYATFITAWAMLYEEKEFEEKVKDYYPLGCIRRL